MKNCLQNGNIKLRALEPDDLDLILHWENNPEYWRVSDTLTPFSKDIIQQYVNAAQDIFAVKQVRLMIDDTDIQKTIGAIDLFDFDPRHQHAGTGILIDTPYRKNGAASKALNLLKTYARDVVGIRNLTARIHDDNLASIRLFEHNGFSRAGVLEKWHCHQGVWIDEFIYQCKLV